MPAWAASGLLPLPQLVWLGILSFPSVATAESELYPAAFCRVMVGSLKIRPSFRGIWGVRQFLQNANDDGALLLYWIELYIIDIDWRYWVLSGHVRFFHALLLGDTTTRRQDSQFDEPSQNLSKGQFIGKPSI
jgi:hypothetical protein